MLVFSSGREDSLTHVDSLKDQVKNIKIKHFNINSYEGMKHAIKYDVFDDLHSVLLDESGNILKRFSGSIPNLNQLISL